MSARADEERRLAKANCHIAETEERIRVQQVRIIALRSVGYPTEIAQAVLSTMIDSLALIKTHRALSIDRLAYLALPFPKYLSQSE